MKKKIMIFILVLTFLLAIILTGCKKTYLASVETRPIDHSNMLQPSSLALNDDGVYFVENGHLYYREWDGKNSTKLTALNYVDDQINDDESIEFKRYRESFSDSNDLILYDNWLYGLFSRENIDGSIMYSLNRFDLRGENHEKLLSFEDFPSRFRIDSGKVYIYFQDLVNDKFLIKTYDEQLNLLETNTYGPHEDPYGFYLEGGKLIILDSAYTIYDNGNSKISYQLTNPPKFAGDTVEETEVTGIFQQQGKDYSFPGKIVSFASEEYFYVANVSDKQSYQQYNMDGSLNKSISPGDFIDSQGPEGTMFWESDFSLMDRVYDDRYIFGHSQERYFICDLELESCRYLNE